MAYWSENCGVRIGDICTVYSTSTGRTRLEVTARKFVPIIQYLAKTMPIRHVFFIYLERKNFGCVCIRWCDFLDYKLVMYSSILEKNFTEKVER